MTRVLFIQHRAPAGSASPSETLDAALVSAAFGQTVSLLFQGDGVWQLLPDQDASGNGRKSLSAQLSALPLYDVEQLYADADSLAARGLTASQLALPVTVLDAEGMRALLAAQDRILRF